MRCLGIVQQGPESAQGVGLVILFPLAFVSNALVPTQHMPDGPARDRRTGTRSAPSRPRRGSSSAIPNPSAAINAWPMQHPVAASLLWSLAILAVFVPLAAPLYRRRTTE